MDELELDAELIRDGRSKGLRRTRIGPAAGLRYGARRWFVNALAACATFLTVQIVANVASADPAEIRILALGDSLMAGYGLEPGEGFTHQLESKLRAKGIKARVLNGGVSGDTTAGGLARLDWALGDKPDVAIVELGANDMLRGLDPKAAESNLDKILARLKRESIPTLLAGMRSFSNWGPEYAARFEKIFPTLAERHGADLYPFFLEGVIQVPALNLQDGMHPNARGVSVIVERILPQVERLIAAARKAG